MELHHFFAPDMRKAIELVKNSLGMDAIILSQKMVTGGIEIQAAIDRVDTEVENNLILENAFYKKQIASEEHQRNSASAISSVKSELGMLRSLLESQMKLVNESKTNSLSSFHSLIKKEFTKAGFTSEVSNTIVDKLVCEKNYENSFQQAMNITSTMIQTGSSHIFQDGGIFALIGPTGVGKTTCVAKIAAKYVMEHNASDIGLISTDFYRIGAFEQLNTYTKILKIPFLHARNSYEFTDALSRLSNKKLILIDTAGINPIFGDALKKLDALKNKRDNIKYYLTLSANSQYNTLKKYIADFKNIGIDECIITKTDESHAIGGLLSLLIENNIPAAYYSKGQKIPDDFDNVSPEILVKMSLSTNDDHTELNDENKIVVCEEVL